MYKLFDMGIDGTHFTPICASVDAQFAALVVLDPPNSP